VDPSKFVRTKILLGFSSPMRKGRQQTSDQCSGGSGWLVAATRLFVCHHVPRVGSRSIDNSVMVRLCLVLNFFIK